MVFWGGLAALCVATLARDSRFMEDVTWWAFFGLVPSVAGAFVAFAATPPPLSAPEAPQD